MPDEMPKAKAKKPVKFFVEDINSLKPGASNLSWEELTATKQYLFTQESLYKKQLQFPGGLDSLLDPQVKNWCGVDGFNTACWAEMCFLYVDKVLQAQAFFVLYGDRDIWIDAATKYCKNLKAKEAFIQKLRYYPGEEVVEVLQLNLETGKEELYLNGPKADKDKLNAFLHKVGKHHI